MSFQSGGYVYEIWSTPRKRDQRLRRFRICLRLRKPIRQEREIPVIDFSIGSSNIPPCDAVKQAIANACLDDDNYQYSLSPRADLLEAVQEWYASRYGVSLEAEEIFPLKGRPGSA